MVVHTYLILDNESEHDPDDALPNHSRRVETVLLAVTDLFGLLSLHVHQLILVEIEDFLFPA